MGLFDTIVNALTGKNLCPLCGTPGGRASIGKPFACINPLCTNFDPTLVTGSPTMVPPPSTPAPSAVAPAPPPVQAAPAASTSGGPTVGGFAGAGTIEIQYNNFQNQSKRFVVDVASLHREKEHVVARVQPKGRTVTLARKRIQNLADVERVMPARVAPGQNWPTPRERQVLAYHKKHRTSSPLYEKIRAKYPNW